MYCKFSCTVLRLVLGVGTCTTNFTYLGSTCTVHVYLEQRVPDNYVLFYGTPFLRVAPATCNNTVLHVVLLNLVPY